MGFYVSSNSSLFLNHALDGFSPADATKQPRLINEFGIAQVLPRVSETGSGTMEQLTELTAHWANTKAILPSGSFGSFTGQVAGINRDGLLMQNAEFTGGGFLIGAGHYFEEGVFQINAPFTEPVGFGYHEHATATRGQLVLQTNGIFEYTIADAAGVNQTFTFPDVPVSVGAGGPGATRHYVYYHFERSFDGTDTVIRLTVNGVAAAEHSFVGASDPDLATGDQFWGTRAAELGSTQRGLRFAWVRIGWSESALTAPYGNSPWATPKVYEAQTFQAHGDYAGGWLDAGLTGYYWHTIEFSGLVGEGASAFEFRAIGFDDPPRGSLVGVWDDLDWITPALVGPTYLNDAEAGYPRGRYLLLQIRYTPGTGQPLDGAVSSFGGVPAVTAFAIVDDPTSVVPQVTVGGEGVASQTLPVTPEFTYRKRRRARTIRREMEAPYAQTYTQSTRIRGSWGVRWNVTSETEYQTLAAFFDGLGASEPFFFTPLDSETPVSVVCPVRVKFSQVGGVKGDNIWSIPELEFVETF